MTNEEHSQATEEEGLDWVQIVLGVALFVSLVAMSVIGHHSISLGA